MQIYSDTVFQQISSLVDLVGYSLMLALAMIIWWGINSGTEIRVSQDSSQTRLAAAEQAASSAGTLSNASQSTRSWIETDNPQEKKELCMSFGDKLPYKNVVVVPAAAQRCWCKWIRRINTLLMALMMLR